MNKKILAIFALIIVATSMSAVSAFDLGDLFGSGENETVTIDGIDFNVPEGYENGTDEAIKETSKVFKDVGYNVSTQAYVKDSIGVGLIVVDFKNIGIGDDEVAEYFLSDTPTTINGVNGSSHTEDGAYMFCYQKDGKLVIVSTDSEKTVAEFVIP